MKTMSNLNIIIKPTHYCNLQCKYCYVDKNAENGYMSQETLKEAISQSMDYLGDNGLVRFIWHGGEPLLVGIDFYKKVIEYQKEAKSITKCNYKNSIQSNLTLLNQDWINFFKENNFVVSSSVDGPREIHDVQRVNCKDQGTLDNVLEKIKLFNDNNCKISTIAVITKNTLKEFDKFYDFFKKNDLYTKLNVLFPSGKADNNFEDLGLNPKEYGQFLINIFDKWVNDSDSLLSMSLSLNDLIFSLITNHGPTCDYKGNCQSSFVSIGPLGDVYPCGRFDGLEEFKYGNVNELNGFSKAMNCDLRLKLKNRQLSDDCTSCEISSLCNSGCMHNAYLNENIFGKDYFCVSRKMIYSHVKKFLIDQLDKARPD